MATRETALALTQELRDEKRKEARLARIEELEDDTFERANGVVNAFMAFGEIDPDQSEPPEAWIEEYGLAAARQRLAVAKMGWAPASVAPAGAKLAAQVMAGIARGRGYRVRVTQNNLNVKLSLPAPTTAEHPGPITYEVRDLET